MRDDPPLHATTAESVSDLLTRGILGTAIYCEDPQTRDFFQSLVK